MNPIDHQIQFGLPAIRIQANMAGEVDGAVVLVGLEGLTSAAISRRS